MFIKQYQVLLVHRLMQPQFHAQHEARRGGGGGGRNIFSMARTSFTKVINNTARISVDYSTAYHALTTLTLYLPDTATV